MKYRLIFLFPEDASEDQTDQGTAVEHLVEDGHGEIHAPGLDPDSESLRILEKDRGDQAHDRAHDAADADGDGIGDELGPVRRSHYGEGKLSRDLSDDEELKDKGDRRHDRQLMEGRKKGCI